MVVGKMAGFGELHVFRFYEHTWLFVQAVSQMRTFCERVGISTYSIVDSDPAERFPLGIVQIHPSPTLTH